MQVEMGIIGGTGFYDPGLLKNRKEVKLDTPYGSPSDVIEVGEMNSTLVAFLPRHGRKHSIRPTEVNSRANIHALKQLGVKRILAPSTVGSLKEEYKPGDIVLVDQFIDRTTRREQSFYMGPKVCHISVAEPTCPELRKILGNVADKMKISYHKTGTYVCVEGPRFSTIAESRMFRMWGADVVGMTLVPECVLAREAQICYASIATVTDYDCWKDHAVCAIEIARTMKENIEKVKDLVSKTVRTMPAKKGCKCEEDLKNATV